MNVGATLWALVEERADATPDALFAVDARGCRLSFADYRASASRVAAGLRGLGVGEGTLVAWMLPTSLDALVLSASLARLGAVQCPLLPAYRERELAFALRQTGARHLVVAARFRGHDVASMAQAVAREIAAAGGVSPTVVAVDESLPEGDPRSLAGAGHGRDAEARWIYYTSGTTADPKGVRHADATLRAAAVGLVDAFELGPEDRAAIVFPLTHVGGALWLMASLVSGAALLVMDTWGPAAIDALARHGVTQAGAGTVFHQAYLAAQLARPGSPLFPRVRAFPGGGAPKPPALHYELKRAFGGAGIVSGYGLTECPAITMNQLRDADAKLALTEGRASPRASGGRSAVRILLRDGREAAPGEEGEVRVRGPQLFRGYVDGALDRDAFDAEGSFRTGDLGTVDAEGYLTITGRLKDIIVRKGENISAREVENLLYRHPRVADVAVVGVPDPELGERCCAAVVPKDPREPPTLADLADFLVAEGLMRQKIPERLELERELPRNANGKIEKRVLRERYRRT